MGHREKPGNWGKMRNQRKRALGENEAPRKMEHPGEVRHQGKNGPVRKKWEPGNK